MYKMECYFLDEPYHGKVSEENGKLCVYLRKKAPEKSDWHEICNFSMSVAYHAMNDIEGRSRCFIFRCVVKKDSDGGENEPFYVPLARDDCEKFSDLHAIFKEKKVGHNACLLYDMGNKSNRFSAWCRKLMDVYEKAEAQKKGALVVERTGMTFTKFELISICFIMHMELFLGLSNINGFLSGMLVSICPKNST
jgi:hypothetical protein